MSQEKLPKVFIATGGTGGHLFSAQKLADMLKGKTDIIFIGKGLNKNPYLKKNKYKTLSISSAPLKKSIRILFSCISILKGCFESLFHLITKKPDVIVGFGSYHTFPLLLVAKLLRKKILLFEANCIVGQVNRIIASKKIPLACQFPLKHTLKSKKVIKVMPFPFSSFSKQISKSQPNKKNTLLVFGGSQGASFINELFIQLAQNGFLKEGLEQSISLIHITGDKKVQKTVEKIYLEKGVDARVLSFTHDMESLYKQAHLVICRAGALTIAELLYYQKPAILIPYPFAKDNHQKINAQFFEEIGGGKYFEQKELSQQKLKKAIIELLEKNKYSALLRHLLIHKMEKKEKLDTLVLDLCKKTQTITF